MDEIFSGGLQMPRFSKVWCTSEKPAFLRSRGVPPKTHITFQPVAFKPVWESCLWRDQACKKWYIALQLRNFCFTDASGAQTQTCMGFWFLLLLLRSRANLKELSTTCLQDCPNAVETDRGPGDRLLKVNCLAMIQHHRTNMSAELQLLPLSDWGVFQVGVLVFKESILRYDWMKCDPASRNWSHPRSLEIVLAVLWGGRRCKAHGAGCDDSKGNKRALAALSLQIFFKVFISGSLPYIHPWL